MFSILKSLYKKFSEIEYDEIPNPPYEYEFLLSLDEDKYPQYLEKMYKSTTGEGLNIKSPKKFNEKIQWLKLYDATPLKKQLTDKVLVRDWVKDKIGEQYLKPVLQICSTFDEINFEKLPQKFIIKCNHGCKWHYKIKNKDLFLEEKELFTFIKNKFDSWLITEFWPWAGFELQYKNIKPQLIIEPLLIDDNDNTPVEYQIYCFNGKPKIYETVRFSIPSVCCVYDENYKESEIVFEQSYLKCYEKPEHLLKEAVKLSSVLAKGFKLVRVDWMVYKNKIYFNEMTFSPFSGFFKFRKEKWNRKLGSMLKLH